jgi:hypothetical protein
VDEETADETEGRGWCVTSQGSHLSPAAKKYCGETPLRMKMTW